MRLSDLIQGTGVELATPEAAGVRVCDLTEDSRTVLPGSLFVARPGAKADGRRFIDAAIEAGASAILTTRDAPRARNRPGKLGWLVADDIPSSVAQLAERFFGDPGKTLRLIGVTGTNGKTTTSRLLYQLLNSPRKRAGLISTVCIDDGFEVGEATLTTPSAIEISHALRNMVDAGRSLAVVETSSHALLQGRVCALMFDVGVFTNLTGEHLDYHKTMEEYGAAKSRLFGQLKSDGVGVINVDDPASDVMIRACGDRKVLRCSVRDSSRAECFAEARELDVDRGMDTTLHGPWGTIRGRIAMIGAHNLMNCLQAVAAAHACGMKAEQIESLVPRLTPPPGRLQQIKIRKKESPIRVFVDYAHSDDALEKTLSAIAPFAKTHGGSFIVCFGCGGDRDRYKRPRSAAVVCRYADQVMVTVNDAHTEAPTQIIEDILGGVPQDVRSKVQVDPDRGRAIRRAIGLANPGDTVLIAGKGHEKYQYLPDGKGGEYRIEFDDAEAAASALRARLEELETNSKRSVSEAPMGAAKP